MECQRRIGIVGLPCTGKTTLAIKLAKEIKTKQKLSDDECIVFTSYEDDKCLYEKEKIGELIKFEGEFEEFPKFVKEKVSSKTKLLILDGYCLGAGIPEDIFHQIKNYIVIFRHPVVLLKMISFFNSVYSFKFNDAHRHKQLANGLESKRDVCFDKKLFESMEKHDILAIDLIEKSANVHNRDKF
jgi:hypothetical protein